MACFISQLEHFLVPETMAPLYVLSKVCMAHSMCRAKSPLFPFMCGAKSANLLRTWMEAMETLLRTWKGAMQTLLRQYLRSLYDLCDHFGEEEKIFWGRVPLKHKCVYWEEKYYFILTSDFNIYISKICKQLFCVKQNLRICVAALYVALKLYRKPVLYLIVQERRAPSGGWAASDSPSLHKLQSSSSYLVAF